MRKLIEGFVRFKNEVYPQYRERFHELASQQNPETLFYDIPHAEFKIYDSDRRAFAPLEGVAVAE